MRNESRIVQTSLGFLQGIRWKDVIQFRGVPYAEAPIGALRFSPARPVSAWTGIRDASRHGSIAPQPPHPLRDVVRDAYEPPQGEDCLSLTISTPAMDQEKRPVVVWLHGGSYMTGAGSLDWYDGAQLAKDGNMVTVGVNYRLGALGFLYYPEVSDGIMGISDILTALRWVQDHIECFGGDPDQVTVMGQSAGAHAIMCLLAMPEARGLFQRAILQSAVASLSPLSEAKAFELGKRLLDLLNVDQRSPEEIISQLNTIPPVQIIQASGKLAQDISRLGHIDLPFMPVFDHLSTSDRFIEMAAKGAGEAGIDLIIGTNREEAHVYLGSVKGLDPALVNEHFAALTGTEEAIERYRRRRPGSTTADLLSDLMTDYIFRFPSLRLAEAVYQTGSRTWVYQLDWAPPGSPYKACHGLEVPFVFGNFEASKDAPILQGASSEVVADLSTAIRSAWIGFIRTGNPGVFNPWPSYEPNQRQTMRFASVIGAVGDLAEINRFF
ncbi:carboxylesterase/lipase family protein [Paenibacillus mucilaginosus]|uniref:Carboxylic ester hydrolase n=1 Tax=Paenibacillus mucilaginosus (strain KNP414) TaxID=1036673 RepID=F8FJJ7_PAEMK|nr:carboxylesterase family protein [Paenibacillus mucilaginosus]AEI42847.1 PnbA [Paenibacillus mucilaginosus KNP414]MCG7216478.1 carboxylesterase family protein [Paenibacillus mucilaginosus]WDM31018.1 carboxylesterase family protein [Paenibacillus mucilaginosus]